MKLEHKKVTSVKSTIELLRKFYKHSIHSCPPCMRLGTELNKLGTLVEMVN